MDTSVIRRAEPLDVVRAYLHLSKPRIVALLIFTTITAAFIAADGRPNPIILLWTTLGGAGAAMSASAWNQIIDRKMDAQMERTARRPIPSGRIKVRDAVLYATFVLVSSILLLGLAVNWLTAWLSLIGAIYYVVLYTMILKRNTSVNIVIGGGAGAMPVLVGWAAITQSLPIEAWVLFAIIFYWTPPHSWALALIVNDEYARVGVPMMPAAHGEKATYWQILVYSILLWIISLLPYALGMLGLLYTLSAFVLGLGLIILSMRLMYRSTPALQYVLWKYSTYYLALLFLVMIFDSVIL
ncbi:MAG: heme o synthase [Phototrophicaceae bacterium]